MTFREMFEDAYEMWSQERKKHKRAVNQQRKKLVMTAFKELTGVDAYPGWVKGNTITLDEGEIVLLHVADGFWKVLGTCQDCGRKNLWSEHSNGRPNDLAFIGEQLRNFQPDPYLHDCPALKFEEPLQTWEEALVESIKEAINELTGPDHR